jgi:5-methylcytosine-specific restriction endonuclease McrA
MKLINCVNCHSTGIHVGKQLCKNCYWKEYRKLNRDKIKQRNHNYTIKNREKIKSQCKKYRLQYRDAILESQRLWYIKNRDRLLEKAEKYRNENREKIKEKRRLYWRKKEVKIRDRFRKRFGRYGRIFAKNAEIVQNSADHKCMNCGASDSRKVFNVHHIIPFALIRSNEIWNLEYLCKACHIKREKYFKALLKELDIFTPSLKNFRFFK